MTSTRSSISSNRRCRRREHPPPRCSTSHRRRWKPPVLPHRGLSLPALPVTPKHQHGLSQTPENNHTDGAASLPAMRPSQRVVRTSRRGSVPRRLVSRSVAGSRGRGVGVPVFAHRYGPERGISASDPWSGPVDGLSVPENSAVVVDVLRCGPMLSPRVPNLVPIPGPRMERETPGQRPRPNYGHPHPPPACRDPPSWAMSSQCGRGLIVPPTLTPRSRAKPA